MVRYGFYFKTRLLPILLYNIVSIVFIYIVRKDDWYAIPSSIFVLLGEKEYIYIYIYIYILFTITALLGIIE